MNIFHHVQRCCLLLYFSIVLTAGLAGSAAAQSADGLPAPPGQIIVGPVFIRGDGSVPSIINGAQANAYLGQTHEPFSFLDSAPAVVVRTSTPTQYVRFYSPQGAAATGNAGASTALGSFLAGSNTVRGLTPAQIKDALALPWLPENVTIVTIPAGTCILVGTGGPVLGRFPGVPGRSGYPAGPWGKGGPAQEYLIGTSANPGCEGAQRLPPSDYVNQQPVGAYALAYTPRAGGGNAGAVANALDHAMLPPLFSDMDSIYNALDLLNVGSPTPLRLALTQLDGEIYADAPSVAINVGQMFLDVLHDQTHLARSLTGLNNGSGLRPWMSSFGGGGALFGGNDVHGLGYGGGGGAVGVDYVFNPSLQAGVAAAYVRSAFNTSGISGSGSLDSVALGTYAGYTAGNMYIDGALGYSYNSAGANRTIAFPGVSREAFANWAASAFLSRVEAGYHFALVDRATITPFASMQGIVVGQDGFGESGAGAISLRVNAATTASALGVLGTEFAYDIPVNSVALNVAARIGWAHDYADTHRGVVAGFQGLSDASFAVAGVNAPRDAAAVGLRVTLPWQPGDLFIRYDGILASKASINSATAGLRVSF
ncbi:conserved exported protein of unknown function [Methylocella tundrae]|uniref:Autotransporter domain-containing protein n=1 Tax=Methylocella tundrae TaxID=227605 RepID=A0A4U8Z5U2_METTU|nr:conserved exported protein of unknown function [Methylocella tundrae]